MTNSLFRTGRFAGILVTAVIALAACAPASPSAIVPPAQAPTLTAPTYDYGPAATPAAAPTTAPAAAPAAGKTSALEFQNDMRKLWEDHITWTRLYIISVAHDLPDKDVTAERLLANQTDLGNAVKPYYGDAAGDQLTALLKDHILGAVDLLDAAKAGDQARVQAASDKWNQNGKDIAAFLNSANGANWPLATMQEAMQMHLDLTLKEAQDRLGGNYAEDVKDYDAVHDHILQMSDVVSSGIIAQFPDRFDATGNAKEAELRLAMRKLWEDHAQWTRFYIISVAHDLPDKDVTAERLLANQTDIGNAFKTYYGNEAGDQLTALLRDHILGAAKLLDAAKAGDQARVDAASQEWNDNGKAIAAFLNKANGQHWPLDTAQSIMQMHLDQTVKEAQDRLGGNYVEDIRDYDIVHDHILDMADILSGGVIAQFPDKFK